MRSPFRCNQETGLYSGVRIRFGASTYECRHLIGLFTFTRSSMAVFRHECALAAHETAYNAAQLSFVKGAIRLKRSVDLLAALRALFSVLG